MNSLLDKCHNLYNNYYPMLFDDVARPQFWFVIVLGLIILLTVTEIKTQSYYNGNSKMYNKTKNKYDESHKRSKKSSKYIEEIIDQVNLNHEVVIWRRALLTSIIMALVILLFYSDNLPSGYNFFITTFILFVVVYMIFSWFNWNWWKNKDNEIEKELLNLRHQLKEKELNDKYNKNIEEYIRF